MPRFFIDAKAQKSDTVTLVGEDARHIALSLRMAKGDAVTVSGPDGVEYECVLTDIHPESVVAEVVREKLNLTESPCEIRLYVGLPKGDKLDLIIQKATELGVAKIIPFSSERCVVKPDAGSADKKLQRRQRIAEEAAKQCGRGRIPEVVHPMRFADAVKDAAAADVPLFLYEGEGTESLYPVLKEKLRRGATVSVMTGAEGGFSPSEVEAAVSLGMKSCGIGRRILRCETAPLYVLSAVAYESELNPYF